MVAAGGPAAPHSITPLPSMHALDESMHAGELTLSVSGENRGAVLNRTVFGFLPYWGGDTWLRYDLISVLACFGVEMGAQGTITSWHGFPSLFETAVDSIQAAGGTAVVTVTCFSSATIHSILTTYRETALASLLNLVTDHSVTGICIDFEGVSSSDRDALVAFISDLRSLLDSQAPGSHLSICTPAVDWNSAFDYSTLAENCDALFMMCYPFHGSWSAVAGPCCPLIGWGSPESSSNMTWCMGDYAINAGENHDRIVVGLPYYGHRWETEDNGTHSAVTGNYTTLLYATLAAEAEAHGRLWDTESLTPWYVYWYSGWNQGWYDDEESLGLKYDMIRQADLQGAGIWALGYDGSREELWDELEDSFTGPVWTDSLTDNLESRFTAMGPAEYWRNSTAGGIYYSYFYTYSIATGPDVSSAQWTFELPDSSSCYLLEAYLPEGGAADVDYRIHHGGGIDTVSVDQGDHGGQWVSLGGPYWASNGLSVIIGDCTGSAGERIVADAIRFAPPTGIGHGGESSTAQSFRLISPNPGHSFTLLVPASDDARKVLLFDMAGRAVREWHLPLGDEVSIQWIPDDDRCTGVYSAILLTDNEVFRLGLVLISSYSRSR